MSSFLKTLKRIKAILPPTYRRTAVLFFLLSLTLLIFDVFSVFLLIPLIITLIDSNEAIPYIPLTILKDNPYLLLACVLLFFIIKNYISIRVNNYQAKTAYALSSNYSVALAKHYLLGNYLAFKKQKQSTIIKEIIFVTNDFVINMTLSINAFLAEFTLLIFLIAIGFYFYFSVSLFISIIIFSIFLFLKYFNRKEVETINRNRSKYHDNNISNLTNLLNGYMSIKSSTLIQHFINKFSKSNQKLNQNYAVLHAKRMNTSRQTEIIIVVLICAVFAYINLFFAERFNAVVFLSIFGTLLFKAIPSLNRLNIALTDINSYKYSLDILEEKLLQISKIEAYDKPLTFNDAIVLKDISFGYDKNNLIVRDVNLTIKKGDFIAIDGKSGAGKTTLLNIVSKLINADSGEIYLDSLIITDINKYAYFNLITYLSQNPFIYEGTVLNNLVLDADRIVEQEVKIVLKELHILETVMSLPNGLDSYIGIQGSHLSGGQLQRLCIARALLSKPQILVLDEATNNLDKQTELTVLKYIKTYTKQNNITVISVSHHLEINNPFYDFILNLNTSK